MSAQDEQKRLVAREALRYVVEDAWLGVGSGSTANFFIDELATAPLMCNRLFARASMNRLAVEPEPTPSHASSTT